MSAKKSHSLVSLGEYQVCLNGRLVSFQLKQSHYLHGIRLEIRQDTGLTVVVPVEYRQGEVDHILQKKACWILRHLPDSQPLQLPLFCKELDHGEKISYLGKKIELRITNTADSAEPVRLEGRRIYINLNGHRNSVTLTLEKWYRGQAKVIFTRKADAFKNVMGVSYNKILIRGQKTRWGSCSPRGTLSLNWKLLMAPESVIDYVIIHELAHLRHMNHSRKFWELVAKHCPNWKKHRRWLTLHEEELKTLAAFDLPRT